LSLASWLATIFAVLELSNAVLKLSLPILILSHDEVGSMSETFILIPGRTSKQGCGISEGKFKENYQSEINALQVNPDDMERLGLTKGDRVRVTSEWGQIEIAIIPSPKDELPAGLLFMAYGDMSSKLMGGDTHGSGMPTSKGLDVQLDVLK
jgi:formylmethanofuran dehydrogenase subunit D